LKIQSSLFLRQTFLVLKDIGSSNGTMVDSQEIAIIADISITLRRSYCTWRLPAVGTIRSDPTANGSGDEITLGHGTRIKLIN
jgi:pSer/pThr/pTyr-binding forkhead associated (FHA) protein